MTDITPLIPKGKQIITAYGNGGFTISGQRYDSSVIVFSDRVAEWAAGDVGILNIQDFSEIIANKAEIEILLFGTGIKTIFPPREVLQGFKSAGIALEIMDTGAACRTYSVLLAEERKVAAALLAV